ncbi:MAG: hypothetical protein V1793_05965 [Pseudomonadota bacterium]
MIDYDPEQQVASKTIRTLLHTRWVQDGNTDFMLGFTGSTDNHMGQPGNTVLNQCGFPYRGGVTGIATPTFVRSGLWQALYDRHTLAATSECRLGLLVAVETHGNHLLMGDFGTHDGTIRVRALGGSSVHRLEILVDGCLQEIVAGHTADRTYAVSGTRHYI